jgi:hypothetical protein
MIKLILCIAALSGLALA